MSKEQTPMQELLSIVEELKSKGQKVDTNGLEDWINSVGLGKEKEHTKAKVLEALERETPKIWKLSRETFWNHPNGRNMTGEHYYETEVKPNYE